jgi:quercetin dioxygenase-like cupin family protein
METETPKDARLRPHPQDRFAPLQIVIDLGVNVDRLRREHQTGEGGHRQETLYKDRSLTIALFLFERFTGLKAHRVAGLVSIHVLRGTLKITAEGQVHELRDGQMLLLAPGVSHDVRAEEESEMLLMVRLANE